MKKLVLEIVDALKVILLLSDWTITVRFEERNKDESEGMTVLAEILPSENYREAILYVFPVFFEHEDTKEKKVACLIHELLHLVVVRMANAIEKAREGRMVTKDEAVDAEERTVLHLAHIIAKGR